MNVTVTFEPVSLIIAISIFLATIIIEFDENDNMFWFWVSLGLAIVSYFMMFGVICAIG